MNAVEKGRSRQRRCVGVDARQGVLRVVENEVAPCQVPLESAHRARLEREPQPFLLDCSRSASSRNRSLRLKPVAVFSLPTLSAVAAPLSFVMPDLSKPDFLKSKSLPALSPILTALRAEKTTLALGPATERISSCVSELDLSATPRSAWLW